MRDLLNNLNEQRRREFYIKKHHIDLYNDILKFKENIKDGYVNYSELLFKYYHNILESPKCKKCHNKTKFCGFNSGYNIYCSKKCVMSDKEVVKKRNEKSVISNMRKYGVSNYSKTDECKRKVVSTNLNKYGTEYYTQTDEYIEKSKESNLKKYGTEYYTQTDEFREKSKESNLKKYGVDHHTQTDEFKQKMVKINLKKHGVEHYTQTDEFREKSIITNLDKYGTKHHMTHKRNNGELKKLHNKKIVKYYQNFNDNLDLVSINDDLISFISNSCGHEFDISKQLLYLRDKKNMEICTICNSTKSNCTSHYELQIHKFLESIGVTFNINDKSIITPYELDIYIPEHNLAIEFNGLYWHSELYKDKKYHINKTNLCLSKGINLFHVWEDDWKYKQDIVKSMIGYKLGKSKVIYARKCDVRNVTQKERKVFLEKNHLQGNCNSSVNIGLYYNNELVSLMTFGKLRINLGNKKSIDGHFELLRFSNKLNHTIVGGASKLLNFFKNNFKFTKIITYSKNDHSTGHLYETIGFNYIKDTPCGYSYVGDSKIKENRYRYNKHTLVKDGYDSNLTEREIMTDRGFYRVYDSGNKKWELNNDSIVERGV